MTEPPATPATPPATTVSTPAAAYRGVVADIIDGRRPAGAYPPEAPRLVIVRHHRPRSLSDLAPDELTQLHAAWYEEGGPDLAEVLADEENEVEAAEVVDEAGRLRYRLYGWNFGVGFLFPPAGLEVVAFGAQHDLEHWSPAQRPLFAAMDRALRAGGHGFTQPLHFCWDDDGCWVQLASAAPHSVGSEPYLRQAFARAPQPPPAELPRS